MPIERCEREGCQREQVPAFKPGCSHGCRVSIGKARARAERSGLASKEPIVETRAPSPPAGSIAEPAPTPMPASPPDADKDSRSVNAPPAPVNAIALPEDANAQRVAEIVKHLSIVARLMGVPCELRVIIGADGRVELPPFRAGMGT